MKHVSARLKSEIKLSITQVDALTQQGCWQANYSRLQRVSIAKG